MRGKGTSRGHSQPRGCSGNKTLKRCKMKGKADNVVLIDIDSDNFHNVIIIDVPESLQQNLRGSSVLRKDKNPPFHCIISIDDDEENDNHHGFGVEGGGDLDSDATSSKRSCPASKHSRNSADSDGDECQFIRERKSPLKFSKCKQAYSGKAPTRNRYGLSSESESGSSESDCSDCELMEGSFGKLHEQWEKASLKRKYDVCNGQSGLEDQASASGSHSDTRQTVEVDNITEQHPEAPVCSSSSNANYDKENLSAFIATCDGNLGCTSLSPEMESPFADFDRKSTEKTQSSYKKADVQDGGETFTEDPLFNHAECQTHKHVNHDGANFSHEEKQSSRGPSLWSSQEQGDRQANHAKMFSQDKQQNIPEEPSLSNSQPSLNIHFDHSKANVQDEEASLCKSQHSVEKELNHDRVISGDKDEEFQQAPSSCNTHSRNESKHERTSFGEREKSVAGEPSFWNTQQCDETHVNHGVPPFEDEVGSVPEETFFCKVPSRGKSEVNNEKACYQEKEKLVTEEPSLCDIQPNETEIKLGRSCLVEAKEPFIESMSRSQPRDKRDNPLKAQDGDVTCAVQSYIINEREKLKETDEYKRAVEEEWASRQRQLQIQAEEAQRLRKRRRAESMRLLDVERRQKQRVEAMRETQKKDEENMNLREQLRVEVRKELYKLEMTCSDMASLLRGLGIHVGGGFYPLSHEVHAAYKRALLTFHPDRASRTDIRQQVEAEEKFKLISRMKDKLLLT